MVHSIGLGLFPSSGLVEVLGCVGVASDCLYGGRGPNDLDSQPLVTGRSSLAVSGHTHIHPTCMHA